MGQSHIDFVCVGEDLYDNAIEYGAVRREAIDGILRIEPTGRSTGVGVVYRVDNYVRSLFYTIKIITSSSTPCYAQVLRGNSTNGYTKLSERFPLTQGSSKTTSFNFFDQVTDINTIFIGVFFAKPVPSQTLTVSFVSVLPLFSGPSLNDNTLNAIQVDNDITRTVESGNTYYIVSPSDHTVLLLPTPLPRYQVSIVALSGTYALHLPSDSVKIFINDILRSGPQTIVGDDISSIYIKTIKYKNGYVWYAYSQNGVGVGYPIVRHISLENDYSRPDVTATGNIIEVGASSIHTVGFCWSEDPHPTITDSYIEGTPPEGTGEFSAEGSVDPLDTPLYGRIFATNSRGTGYGKGVTFQTGICLVEGTMIKLADGSERKIEEILYEDNLLVWNFDEGKFDVAKPMWIKRRGDSIWYNLFRFRSGATLKTIMRHRIFNKDLGVFTGDPDELPSGSKTVRVERGILIEDEVESIEKIYDDISHYNIITEKHMNVFADGVLTSCRYNNLYPIKDMKFDKTGMRAYVPFESYTDVPRYYYDMLRLSEQEIKIKNTDIYVARMIKRSQAVMFVDHQGVLYNGEWPESGQPLPNFNREKVVKLNELLYKLQSPVIVVSSDWRKRVSLQEMKKFYIDQGVSYGPHFYTDVIQCKLIKDVAETRVKEINQWLQNNPQYLDYYILDDLNFKNFMTEKENERHVKLD